MVTMRPIAVAVAVLALTVGCQKKQSLQTLMQQQADADCVKNLGPGWVAEGVDDKMPYGASCRPVSDCAKAAELYDECKTNHNATKQASATASKPVVTLDMSRAVPIGGGDTVDLRHAAPAGDKGCQAYWQPIIDKVCKR
jgi:hypothetical protein